MVGPALPARYAAVLFTLVLCGILFFGLWPFGRVRNDVQWLADQRAVRMGTYSTILSTAPLAGAPSGACSVEMWLRPISKKGWGTLLAFYDPIGVSLHQSLSDLRLDSGPGRRGSRAYADHVFLPGQREFVSVVMASSGTDVYVNASAVRHVAGFRPPPCSGRFVAGDSPEETESWQGDFGGLAIYRRHLTAEEVMMHYQSWKTLGRPGGVTPDALYLFGDEKGQRISDHGLLHADLFVPGRYTVVRQTVLETPWDAFQPSWEYVKDVLVNVAGFVPFGITLSALLAAWGKTSGATPLTVLLGLTVSLLIEILQSHVPTRHSDFTDVLTNTLGSGAGAIWRENKYSPLVRWLGCAGVASGIQISRKRHLLQNFRTRYGRAGHLRNG